MYSRATNTVGGSYTGTSEGLHETVVVPSLSCPLPTGKNVIWSCSFQLAWNELRKMTGGPVETERPNSTVARLNAGRQSELDLEKYSYLAAAGYGKDGIVGEIANQMRARFPAVDPAFLPADASSFFVLFSYMEASVKYATAFDDCTEPLVFRDSRGVRTPVTSFGLCPASPQDQRPFAYFQVYVLFETALKVADVDSNEFALDLSRATEPYQVVLARVHAKTTLEEIFQDIDRKRQTDKSISPMLMPGDILIAPNIVFRISHHFRELEGVEVVGTGPISEAGQLIDFKLDRFGATVASKGDARLVGIHSGHYVFDRPFLVYMKRRKGQYPFFAMWVDNAELLAKSNPG